ncbi:MAG: ATP-binding cassette domain-containing protein [Actinomycetota bacterium]
MTAPVEVLRSIDLDVSVGDHVAITGPSGSGKSTLLNVIGLLDHPSGGQLRLAGIDVESISSVERARLRASQIGFVFQSFHLLDDRTAVENVQLAFRYHPTPPSDQRKAAVDALVRVGLEHRLDALPPTLSGGERQRVAIARAIVTRPALLLADEPTGNLDSRTSAEVLDLFDELHAMGLTLLVVTHDPDTSRRAHRTITLRDGAIVDDTREHSATIESDGNGRQTSPRTPHTPSRLRRVTHAAADTFTSMLARPARTALTALGTVLGIASLLATIGIADTAGNRIVARFDTLSATEVTVEPVRRSGDPLNPALPWNVEDRLGHLNGVISAGAYTTVDTPGATRTIPLLGTTTVESRDLDVVAATPGLFDAVLTDIDRGRTFGSIHQRRSDAVAVLGPAAARRLGITRPETSPSIFVGDAQLTVIGTISDAGVYNEPNLLDAIIVPDTWALTRYGSLTPTHTIIRTEPGAAPLIARQAPIALNPNQPTELLARRAAEPTRVRDEVRQDLNGLLILLGLIALVVGGLGIANVTLVSVLERTGEIGLRGALGGRRSSIATQFLAESALLGLIAGIIGASLGTLIVTAVAAIRDWTPVLDPVLPLAAPALGALVGTVAGAYPAWRAASIDPATALRTGT